MSTLEQLQIPPIPAGIDNPGDWDALAQQISLATGMPANVSPETIVGMLGSAVPLLFAADGNGNANLLRGTFSDPVVAQCALNRGELTSGTPTSVAAHLVGSRIDGGHPVVRVHLTIQTRRPDGEEGQTHQFWDLQFGDRVTVGQPNCPNCGAPLSDGGLVCSHCHADVRNVVDVPIVVSKLELY